VSVLLLVLTAVLSPLQLGAARVRASGALSGAR
jgi:hypothetical protein